MVDAMLQGMNVSAGDRVILLDLLPNRLLDMNAFNGWDIMSLLFAIIIFNLFCGKSYPAGGRSLLVL